MRKYLTLDHSAGYPVDESLFYECVKCGTVLPSKPPDNIGCVCDNVFIDVDWGRINIKDRSQIRAFMNEDNDSNAGSTQIIQ
jgi:hypothetical protein